ncbi:hypothetical protein [Oceanobacillus sp. FSL W7-1293]|uniref:hypothetical protein n=1 Tax=Oceanobacillus sp. FSL W7-1293 TaxID=2921699 RepID=UPI0030D0327F
MDSLIIFFSIINHPIKISMLKFIEENNSAARLDEVINYFPDKRLLVNQCFWELYNDQLLKIENQKRRDIITISPFGKELTHILRRFDQRSQDHQFYGFYREN